ncbi:uncharacterized protein LOC121601009 [Anopheles merus]|uniref:uncharacterized protein LOC121601009 n=1 Tax=Anopheles merus TaxID=30066 RepID=UPI001BE48F8C|nr:uncharacterized protein LOC121601009 [Anopheles merus]
MNTNMRDAITTQERLLILLHYLATGHTFSSLQFLFRVSRSSISRIVKETSLCLNKVLRSYLKLPSTKQQWLEVSQRFEQRWNFPHAIGAMDGKHVKIRAPAHSGSDYYNYKNFFSIVLLVIVDADYNFLFADAGGKGGISGGGILRNSRLFQKLENKLLNIPDPEPLRVPYRVPVPYFLLGDKAFAYTDYCIRPFGGIHSPGSYQRIFNYRHSRARMPVENALGIVTNKFEVLSGPIRLPPDLAKHVVLTPLYLHNFLRKSASRHIYSPPSSFDRVVNGNLVPGDWRANEGLEGLQGVSSRAPDRLLNIRTHVALDFKHNYNHYG